MTRFDCLVAGTTAITMAGFWLATRVLRWDDRRRARRAHGGGR